MHKLFAASVAVLAFAAPGMAAIGKDYPGLGHLKGYHIFSFGAALR